MAIKIICDRCKKEIKKKIIIYRILRFPETDIEDVLLCQDCLKEFKRFMLMGNEEDRPSRIMYNIFRSVRSAEK